MSEDITFERNGKTIVLLQEPSPKDATVESLDSIYKGSDVYWLYAVFGMHSGEPFTIAVKNPHYEADGDESGVYYCLADEGKFWADDLTPIPDSVDDWYSDVINNAVREDFKSLMSDSLMNNENLKQTIREIIKFFQTAIAYIFCKFSLCSLGYIRKPNAETKFELSRADKERSKQNLVAMFRNCARTDTYSDGKLIDECYRYIDDLFEIDSVEAALFTTLLERFQTSIGLEVTPAGMRIDDEIFNDEWQEDFADGNL